MRYKDVEGQLYNYNTIQLRIAKLTRDIESLAEGVASLGGASDGMPRGTEISNPTANNAIRLMEIKAEKETQRAKEARIIQNLDEAMTCLTPEQQAIIKERYFHTKPWEQVARAVGYSISRSKEIRKQAILKMVEVLN